MIPADAASNVRVHFIARNLIFWARNQGQKVRGGMFVSPRQIQWAPVNPWMDYTCKLVDETVLREVSKILLDNVRGKNLWALNIGSVARTLEFFTWREQQLILQILREHYAVQQ